MAGNTVILAPPAAPRPRRRGAGATRTVARVSHLRTATGLTLTLTPPNAGLTLTSHTLAPPPDGVLATCFPSVAVPRRFLLLLYESSFGLEDISEFTPHDRQSTSSLELVGLVKVIRDSRQNRCGTSAADIRPYSGEVPAARTVPVDTSKRREGPSKRKLATSGSWTARGGPATRKLCRTTEAPQRSRIHTETSHGTPRFQTRGPRRCRRII